MELTYMCVIVHANKTSGRNNISFTFPVVLDNGSNKMI